MDPDAGGCRLQPLEQSAAPAPAWLAEVLCSSPAPDKPGLRPCLLRSSTPKSCPATPMPSPELSALVAYPRLSHRPPPLRPVPGQRVESEETASVLTVTLVM